MVPRKWSGKPPPSVVWVVVGLIGKPFPPVVWGLCGWESPSLLLPCGVGSGGWEAPSLPPVVRGLVGCLGGLVVVVKHLQCAKPYSVGEDVVLRLWDVRLSVSADLGDSCWGLYNIEQ